MRIFQWLLSMRRIAYVWGLFVTSAVFIAMLTGSVGRAIATPEARPTLPSAGSVPPGVASAASRKTQLPLIMQSQPVSTGPGLKPPVFGRVFVIVLENKETSNIIGNGDAPYFNSLVRQYGYAANFYATRHPSLPNYLAMTGGDTFGVSSNCNDCFVGAPSIVDQLEAAGKSWKAYQESMPRPCFVGDSGSLYRQKHNPFIYYDRIRNNPARCNRIVPFDQFATDLQANTVPDYVWITPNMCNDMHDCSIATGDAWLKKTVPQILASPAWQQNGVLFITFDEGNSDAGCCNLANGGNIATLILSPLGKPAYRSDVAYDHYSLLRTIEEGWDLPLLGNASCACTPSMGEFFTVPRTR